VFGSPFRQCVFDDGGMVRERDLNKLPLTKLKRFLEPRPKSAPAAVCEFCGVDIAPSHSHAVNLETRSLLCVCRACYLLFMRAGAGGGKYKAVPERYIHLPEFVLSQSQWDRLQIPVGVAFFFFNSSLGRAVAFYPSPAGATESLLSMESWDELVGVNPILASLSGDVEALLVRNIQRRQAFDRFIVPIDACYELVGRIRKTWKGFDGGEDGWAKIDAFFADLRARSDGFPGKTEAQR
jgi:uncharacterized protein DUF5947